MTLSKCYTQYVSTSGKPSSGHKAGKGQSSSQFPRRAVLKNVQTTGQLHSSPMLVRDIQNPACQTAALHEPRTYRCPSWVQKQRGNQTSNCQHMLDHRESKGIQEKKNIYLCFIDYAKAFDCVDHKNLWETLKEMGIPDHLTCLLRNLYTS